MEDILNTHSLPPSDADDSPRLRDGRNTGFTLGSTQQPALDRDAAKSEGIIGRRVVAYFIDIVILSSVWVLATIFSALSLFTLAPLLFALVPLVPLVYHTALIASKRSATLGMRAMGLRVLREGRDEGPDAPQAFILTALFYLSLATSGLLLLWCLFDDRGRCLHDILSGTRTVRDTD